MNKLMDIVGANIREIRKYKKLTQDELAEKCNLQTSYLAGVERGDRNITMSTLEKISIGLEVDTKELFNLKIDLLNSSNNKDILIKAFINELQSKSDTEIELVIRIASDIFKTYKS